MATSKRVTLYNRRKKDDGTTVRIKLGPGRHARDLESGEYRGPGEIATVRAYQMTEIKDLGVPVGEDDEVLDTAAAVADAPRKARRASA